MKGNRWRGALQVVVLMVCAPALLGLAPAAEAARAAAGDDPPPVAKQIRAALAAGDDGRPLRRPLVNEENLPKDVWHKWWTCTIEWDDYRGPICPLGDVDAERKVVVYGDSHAGVWLPALDRMGRQAGFRVVPLLKFGCVPFHVVQRNDGGPYPSCPKFRRWSERKIKDIDPALVILGYRGFWAVDPDPGKTVAESWKQGTRSALRLLNKHTPRLVVLGDVPSKGLRPVECLDADAHMGTCTTRVETKVLRANQVTRKATQATRARYVVTQNLVCADGRCPLVVERIVTYRDASHLSKTWTYRITDELRVPDPAGRRSMTRPPRQVRGE